MCQNAQSANIMAVDMLYIRINYCGDKMKVYDCGCTNDCNPAPDCCNGCGSVIVNVNGGSQPGGEFPDAVAAQAFNTQQQTTVGGTPLTFGASALVSGRSATVGSDDISLTQSGVYIVSFNAVVSAGEDLTVPADLTLQLNNNGTAVSGAALTQTVEAETANYSVAFTALVTVAENAQGVLTVVPDASDFAVTNASLTVAKIGN